MKFLIKDLRAALIALIIGILVIIMSNAFGQGTLFLVLSVLIGLYLLAVVIYQIHEGHFTLNYFRNSIAGCVPKFYPVNRQTKVKLSESFSPTLCELKLPYEEHPSTGSNLDAVSTRKTYDIIKDHIKNQREAVESLRAYLSPKKQLAIDNAWGEYAEPQRTKVPSDPMIGYWGMDEQEARKRAIERIEKILEFVK